MYAMTAARFVHAYCTLIFPEGASAHDNNPLDMASTALGGHLTEVFKVIGQGTHKYIPADRLTQDLGMQIGAGVYCYYHMEDGSYMLLTCKGQLAVWSGKDEDKAVWAGCPGYKGST